MQPLRFLLLALFISGCSMQGSVTAIPHEDRTPGHTTTFYGSSVDSWAVVRPNGSVAGIGFTIPLSAVQSTRTELRSGEDTAVHDPSDGFRLAVPDDVRGKTSLDHIDVDYQPVGHGPAGVYDVPHFDIRFYRINESAQARIDCRDDNPVDGDHMPDGYVLGKSGRPPRGECKPLIGRYAMPVAVLSEVAAGEEWDSATEAFGYSDGRMAFIEVMLARALLLRGDQGSMAIERPANIDGWTAYPSQANFVYDKREDAYDVWLEFPPPDA